MATGGHVAIDTGSDSINEHMTKTLCESCIQKLIPKRTTAINELRTKLLCVHCRDVVVREKFQNHDIILFQKTDSVSIDLDLKEMEICSQHMKKVKFYCEDHDQLCCSRCVIIHRKCDKFNELTVLSEQKGADRDLQSALMKIKEDSLSMIQDVEQSENALAKTIANFSTKINEMKKSLMKLIDDAKLMFELETEHIKTIEAMKVNHSYNALSNLEKNISHILKLYSDAMENGTPQQKFIVARAVEKTLKDSQSVIEEQRKQQLSIKMHLSFAPELSELLKIESDVVQLHVDQTCRNADYYSPRRNNSQNIADLSDPYRPTKMAEMFSELYDNEWTDAFGAINCVLSERQTITFLLDIVMDAYSFCSEKLNKTWRVASAWYLHDSLPNAMQMKKLLKDSRKAMVLNILSEMEKSYKTHLYSVCAIQTLRDTLASEPMRRYVLQCAKLCLLMSANDPPVVIECGEKVDRHAQNSQRRPFDRDKFRHFTISGPFLEYIVWPVMYLHQGGPMLSKGVAQGTREAVVSGKEEYWTWKKPE